MTIRPHCSIDAIRRADLIVVSSVGGDIPTACRRNAALMPWLKRWHRRGVAIAGICSGVALLAEAGLLDGRPATTHWGMIGSCRARYPKVRWQAERFITESDNVFTSGGVYAAVDLSLYLVEKYCGHEVAMQTARSLLLQTPRTWQAGYAAEPPAAQHDDVAIRKVQDWLFENFRTDVRVQRLAALTNMSTRTFARRFKSTIGETPLDYLHRLRINAARHLLESDSLSIRDVSLAVGYEDVAFFRRLFRRHTGTPPRDYRHRFGTRANGLAAAVEQRSRADGQNARVSAAAHRVR
jgi:transcriptional regulator GlxA family with amidase domain